MSYYRDGFGQIKWKLAYCDYCKLNVSDDKICPYKLCPKTGASYLYRDGRNEQNTQNGLNRKPEQTKHLENNNLPEGLDYCPSCDKAFDDKCNCPYKTCCRHQPEPLKMTRQEAIKKLHNTFPFGDADEALCCKLEALGLLKFDEEKPREPRDVIYETLERNALRTSLVQTNCVVDALLKAKYVIIDTTRYDVVDKRSKSA